MWLRMGQSFDCKPICAPATRSGQPLPCMCAQPTVDDGVCPYLHPLLRSRCHWRVLPPPYHASLIDALQQAAGGMSRRARTRPGPGPGPWVALKRILLGPPPLQPVVLALAGGGAGAGAAQQGPFIFNPYAAKRSAAAAAGAVQAVEWVSRRACSCHRCMAEISSRVLCAGMCCCCTVCILLYKHLQLHVLASDSTCVLPAAPACCLL
jgi:hypothetical protein